MTLHPIYLVIVITRITCLDQNDKLILDSQTRKTAGSFMGNEMK